MKRYKLRFSKYYWESKYVKPDTFYLISLSKRWWYTGRCDYDLDVLGFKVRLTVCKNK